ncbi:hypothetical protein J3Q64DRAFT_1693579 [Phycomyces blakesleeanus]|uniref:Uncharacterized protein n=1 Tax=Phycomyces blakesleeanus TaxID=4837 RepID=A0ABR3BE95_PHYBL
MDVVNQLSSLLKLAFDHLILMPITVHFRQFFLFPICQNVCPYLGYLLAQAVVLPHQGNAYGIKPDACGFWASQLTRDMKTQEELNSNMLGRGRGRGRGCGRELVLVLVLGLGVVVVSYWEVVWLVLGISLKKCFATII